MIFRSTDIKGALKYARRAGMRRSQRGFINPFWYVPSGAGFNPQTGVTSAVLKLWIDPSDPSYVSITNDATYGDIFSSVTCKVSGTVFAGGTAVQTPQVDTVLMGARSMNFGMSTIRYLYNSTGINITGSVGTLFMPVYWNTRVNTYMALALYHGTASTALQGTAGIPAIQAWTSTNGPGYSEQYLTGAIYSYNQTTGIAKGARGLYEFNVRSPNSSSYSVLNGTTLTQTVGGGASAPPTPMNFTTIGSTDTLYLPNGCIGEMLFYQGTLSSADATSVRAYLKAKWGTP